MESFPTTLACSSYSATCRQLLRSSYSVISKSHFSWTFHYMTPSFTFNASSLERVLRSRIRVCAGLKVKEGTAARCVWIEVRRGTFWGRYWKDRRGMWGVGGLSVGGLTWPWSRRSGKRWIVLLVEERTCMSPFSIQMILNIIDWLIAHSRLTNTLHSLRISI